MKTFALIGAAGYIAPRHMEAIKACGCDLVAAYDKFDSVGIMDRYFPEAAFFTEFERFDRHLEKLRQSGKKVDYVSICSPNYLHDAHIRFALRIGADAICEKPLVLNPWNAEALMDLEHEASSKVFNILQLRLHPAVLALKAKIDSQPEKHWDVKLRYITSRGQWYHYSWKGDIQKSGGIVTNIGVHFFDMLLWIFGGVKENKVSEHSNSIASGKLSLERANVDWFLSIDKEQLPEEVRAKNQTTYRSLLIDKDEFEFSGGFTDLHTSSYQNILSGNGFQIADAKAALDLVYDIRNKS